MFLSSSNLSTTNSAVWFLLLIIIFPQPKYNWIESKTYLESKSAVIVNLGLNWRPNRCLEDETIEQKKEPSVWVKPLMYPAEIKKFWFCRIVIFVAI